MKTLFTILALIFAVQNSSAQFTDFVTQQIGNADQIIIHNNKLYFTTEIYNPNTWEYNSYIKTIDLSASPFTAQVLYGPFPTNKSFLDLAVLGNTLYTVYYNEDTNKSTFASFNLSQTTPTLTDHLQIFGYVKCIAIYNGYLYYTQLNTSGGITNLERRNLSFTGTNEIINYLGTGVTNDIFFKNNILYLTSQGIKTLDVSQPTSPFISLKTGPFYGGILVGGSTVFYSESSNFNKFPISDPNLVTTLSSTTWVNGMVNQGQLIYATTNNKIVTITDATLAVQTNEMVTKTTLLYPNPTKSTLNFSQELSEIKIVDMSGKLVSQKKEKTKNISVENLPKGNYILQGKTIDGKIINKKLIKN